MFVKIFDQILDSSIANNYELRHFFEDMLKLADLTGVVDMTPEAISRRINLPLEKVVLFLGELVKPDLKSRSQANEGRRIIALDSHRDWGWIIVNYEHYRNIRNQEERRVYNRDAQRKSRQKRGKGGKTYAAIKAEHRGRESRYDRAATNGDTQEMDRIAAEDLPESHI